MSERLQKILSRAGLGSRRRCEELIRSGIVAVNGRQARLGDKATPGQDRITVRGRPISASKQDKVYVLVHKPRGVLSSLQDDTGRNRPTVRDLVPLPGHLYPVGRLDLQSEGLMLITNDGRLAHRLTHPRYGHEKTYRVNLEGKMTLSAIEQWRRGVILDGRITAPAPIQVLTRTRRQTVLRIVLREGRKRQIRRIAARFGHAITRLVRERIGPLELGQLAPAAWRHATPQEVRLLQRAVKRPADRSGKPRDEPKAARHSARGYR